MELNRVKLEPNRVSLLLARKLARTVSEAFPGCLYMPILNFYGLSRCVERFRGRWPVLFIYSRERVLWRLFILFETFVRVVCSNVFCLRRFGPQTSCFVPWVRKNVPGFERPDRRTGRVVTGIHPYVSGLDAFVTGFYPSVTGKNPPDRRTDRLVTVMCPFVSCLEAIVTGFSPSVTGKYPPDRRTDRLVTAMYPFVSGLEAIVTGFYLSVPCVEGNVSVISTPDRAQEFWCIMPISLSFELYPRGPPGAETVPNG